jgi:hypothetical protein
MRSLSLTQAGRCEHAKTERCRCRCGGALHGAKRGLDAAFFAALPADDPHRAHEPRTRQPRQRKLPLFDEVST